MSGGRSITRLRRPTQRGSLADACTVEVRGEDDVTVIAGAGPGDGWEFQRPDSALEALAPDGGSAVVSDATGLAYLVDFATADPTDPTLGSVELGGTDETFAQFTFVDRHGR